MSTKPDAQSKRGILPVEMRTDGALWSSFTRAFRHDPFTTCLIAGVIIGGATASVTGFVLGAIAAYVLASYVNAS